MIENAKVSSEEALWLETVGGTCLVAFLIDFDICSDFTKILKDWCDLFAEVKSHFSSGVLVELSSLEDNFLSGVSDVLNTF